MILPLLCSLMQATFFTTYVLTSGWASLSSEVMQLFPVIWNLLKRYIFQINSDQLSIPSFPYHTEVPKVLLMGLLGFTCAILAPLILPFLLVYFFLCYVVYRNQVSSNLLYVSSLFLKYFCRDEICILFFLLDHDPSRPKSHNYA